MRISNLFEIDIRAYIAGIKVPCSAITINSAFNAPATATLALPPDSRLLGIGRHDRIPVQIFVRNTFSIGSETDYIMLFDGEVDSFGYSSTALGREISVNAHSCMAFLGDVRIRLLNTLNDYAMATLPSEGAAMSSIKSSGITFPASLLLQGIADVKDGNIIKSPFEFIENIGSYFEGLKNDKFKEQKTALGKFYGKYADMLNFSNRYSSLPKYDDTGSWGGACFPILQGLQTSAVLNLLKGVIDEQNLGTIISFINSIASNLEYEISFPSSPRYDSKTGKLNSLVFKPLFYDALAPACNIMFRSHVESIRMNEQVYGIPTRIRVRDLSGPMAMLIDKDNSYLKEFGLIDYYPSSYKDKKAAGDEDYLKNWYATEELDTEKHTGPYLHDTQAPRWFSYVALNKGTEFNELKQRMLAHMFDLKKYEQRNISVSSVFNPFIVPGYPGVVFDSWQNDGSKFAFAGHVVSITHQLTKSSADTGVTMSFCRTLDEAVNNPLEHGVPEIKAVNSSKSEMDEIYGSVLGCKATEYKSLNGGYAKAHGDPTEAYDTNSRGICTLDEYLKFIKSTGTKNNKAELLGNYFSDRTDSGLQEVLRDIADAADSNEIYG